MRTVARLEIQKCRIYPRQILQPLQSEDNDKRNYSHYDLQYDHVHLFTSLTVKKSRYHLERGRRGDFNHELCSPKRALNQRYTDVRLGAQRMMIETMSQSKQIPEF